MPSLEHLIDYYSGVKDGLPARLMYPVSPQKVAVNRLYEDMGIFKLNERNYYENYSVSQFDSEIDPESSNDRNSEN
jgi:hypothetical protein